MKLTTHLHCQIYKCVDLHLHSPYVFIALCLSTGTMLSLSCSVSHMPWRNSQWGQYRSHLVVCLFCPMLHSAGAEVSVECLSHLHLNANYQWRWIGRGGPDAWRARSPYLIPRFLLWDCLKSKVCHTDKSEKERLQLLQP